MNKIIQNFIWFFNPFFLYVFLGIDLEEIELDPSEPPVFRNYKIIKTMLYLEVKTYSTFKQVEVIDKIKSNFLFHKNYFVADLIVGSDLNFFNTVLSEEPTDIEITPIINLTFIFSCYIACDEKLRNEFYELYDGKVPAITQWLLNSIRVGFLNENTYVSKTQFDPVYNTQMTNIDGRIYSRFEEFIHPKYLTEWFKQLEIYCSNNTLFFKHFVLLKKVSLQLNEGEKLTLTGFNQINGQFSTEPTIENLKSKEKYQLVNKSLNAYLVSEKDYKRNKFNIANDEARWLGGGENPETWVIDENEQCENYEIPLMSQLLGFIINCNPADF